MVKIGMTIGDRYEILEKIGTGGMSDVYKAKCHKLNRFVAVKVLKQEFSENANFVSKFRIEAQAAAGLMHPNIVNVYDVGEEDGIHYIVMELVEGITLKKYIEKKAGLSFKEAVSIAIQISMGIGAAHNNHIIHRDIKPQNIIISRDGKVKVTDFGIAKAATSNTITSNVMGSVHYTSPEQARGGYSDEKSDIYSLGITMFEMLTGRVPFNGETTVAIAIKHIQEELPLPSRFAEGIPESVEGIIIKCCQKSPDRRYQNVQELIADLKQSLMNPDEVVAVQNDPDLEGGTKMISDSDMAQIKRRTGYQDTAEYQEQENTNTMRLWSGNTGNVYEEDEAEEYDNPASKMEKITTISLIVGGVIICLILIFLVVHILTGDSDRSNSGSMSGNIIQPAVETPDARVYVKMRDVQGMTVEDARNALTEIGLKSVVEYVESSTIDKGVVISANVSADVEVPEGSTITLTASAGTEKVEVPSVEGSTYVRANNDLTEKGFAVTREDGYSDKVPVGYVISQVPAAGTEVSPGTNITVTVSIGKDRVKVPDIMGYTESEATSALLSAGLKIGSVSYVYNTEYDTGLVCYQSYSNGSYVDPNTSVDIKVSKGLQEFTYKCNVSIEAPTVEEAPGYVSGSEVTIVFIADDGEQLMNTKTQIFPQAGNYYGLKAAGGTITITYTVTGEGTTTTDPVTGNIIHTPGATETKSFTRRVEFVRE